LDLFLYSKLDCQPVSVLQGSDMFTKGRNQPLLFDSERAKGVVVTVFSPVLL
jgi:hypothetical protein